MAKRTNTNLCAAQMTLPQHTKLCWSGWPSKTAIYMKASS